MASPSNTLSTAPPAAPAPIGTDDQHTELAEDVAKLFNDLNVDQEDHELIDSLKALSKKSPKLVKSSEYQAPADPRIFVRSWKMNEFKYYDVPSPFPTLARGLFTQDVKSSSGRTKHRIVARGYDKFFNIGEVPWTTWDSLESHTAPPYTLTLKSNGCIIFIAALTPAKLLVTSKHSIGPTPGASGPESHAQVGERWLRKHLSAAKKTEEQLAHTLWANNWTAVAELCDDSFEEHVLPYSADKTGLHLHGLNTCTKAFQTQPQPVVDAFAREWGFVPTPSTVLSTIPDVKAFTEHVAHAGHWQGDALEGFVVRTHVSTTPTGKGSARAPYAAGSSFFFKVKFDEPYLMYRDWREVTKTLLSKGPSAGHVPKGKLRRPETQLYVRWACAEIRRDRAQFDGFAKGKGIIAARERFLAWMASGEGKDALASGNGEAGQTDAEAGAREEVDLTKGKVIIVPVAIPGVGKTSVAVGLQHLFGFAHVQSDDISSKKAAPIFIKHVSQALRTHDVVIADKNNHLTQHRTQLRDAASKLSPRAHLLALHWPLDLPRATLHRLCSARIAARGANHQTLHAGAHERVLWQFLEGAEELRDAEVDAVVAMDVEEPLEDALARAAGAVANLLGRAQPDAESMGRALAAARAYVPRVKGKKGGGQRAEAEEEVEHGDGEEEGKDGEEGAEAETPSPDTKAKKNGTKKDKKQEKAREKERGKPPRYYGILAEVDLQSVVAPALERASVPPEARKFWEKLVQGKRVQPRPHVTLVHSKQLPGLGSLWERCRAVDALEGAPLLRFRLGHVVWNERIMAVTVVDVGAAEGEVEGREEVAKFVRQLGDEVTERLHVTVGTRDKSVPPVEAKDMVLEWKRKGDGKAGVWSVPLTDVWAKGQVKGLFQ